LKQKILIIILVLVIFLTIVISLLELEKQNKKIQSFEKAYQLLNQLHSDLTNSDELLEKKYNKLEQNYEYALEMKEICLEDSDLCNDIKKRIFEYKNERQI